MARPRQASGARLAFIDDDRGFFTVLDRRLQALGWERSVFAHTVVAEQLAATKLHAVIINPAITGPEYLESPRAASGESPEPDRRRRTLLV